jgi:hypothetical protein
MPVFGVFTMVSGPKLNPMQVKTISAAPPQAIGFSERRLLLRMTLRTSIEIRFDGTPRK